MVVVSNRDEKDEMGLVISSWTDPIKSVTKEEILSIVEEREEGVPVPVLSGVPV